VAMLASKAKAGGSSSSSSQPASNAATPASSREPSRYEAILKRSRWAAGRGLLLCRVCCCCCAGRAAAAVQGVLLPLCRVCCCCVASGYMLGGAPLPPATGTRLPHVNATGRLTQPCPRLTTRHAPETAPRRLPSQDGAPAPPRKPTAFDHIRPNLLKPTAAFKSYCAEARAQREALEDDWDGLSTCEVRAVAAPGRLVVQLVGWDKAGGAVGRLGQGWGRQAGPDTSPPACLLAFAWHLLRPLARLPPSSALPRRPQSMASVCMLKPPSAVAQSWAAGSFSGLRAEASMPSQAFGRSIRAAGAQQRLCCPAALPPAAAHRAASLPVPAAEWRPVLHPRGPLNPAAGAGAGARRAAGQAAGAGTGRHAPQHHQPGAGPGGAPARPRGRTPRPPRVCCAHAQPRPRRHRRCGLGR
jgi:hypothetical protein